MKYNSIGEQLVAKAKELDPSYKPDKFNDMSEALDVILNNGGGGGIPTASINSQTFQLDTSSLTNKDQYVLASMDDGEGYTVYIPLQTYFSSDGYFNKEVKMQTTSHDFRLSLANVSFRSSNNYTLRGETTNIDFTNTLDSTNTWTKLGDIKYIAIEENEMMSGENSYKYLEISGGSNIDKLDIEFTFNGTTTLTQEQVALINSHNNKYVYVKFNEGIVRDNAYIGYVFNLGDLGTGISIVSQPNISGDVIIQSSITIRGTTAVHQENTIAFSIANSGKFLKTNEEGNPEWVSISTPTITFED